MAAATGKVFAVVVVLHLRVLQEGVQVSTRAGRPHERPQVGQGQADPPADMSSSHRIAPPPNNLNPSCAVLDLGLSLSSLLARGGAAGGDIDGGGLPVPLEKQLGDRFSLASSAATNDYYSEGKNLELRMGACSHGGDGCLDLQLRLCY
jgi:hypothetical protein